MKELQQLVAGAADFGVPNSDRGALTVMSRLSAVGFLTAWLLLVAVVGLLALQIERDIRVTSERVCGSWLGTYQLLNEWAAVELPAEDRRGTFVSGSQPTSKPNAPDYVQTTA